MELATDNYTINTELPSLPEAVYEFPSVAPVGDIKQIFEDVVAKVPNFMLEKLSISEQLPFLLKLAENLAVNILMGMDTETADTQSFSFQGNLHCLLEIEKRVGNLTGVEMSSPELMTQSGEEMVGYIGQNDNEDLNRNVEKVSNIKSVGTNTDNENLEEKGILCRLLDDPKFSRSGRIIRKNESQLFIYDEDNSENSNSETRNKNTRKESEYGDLQIVSIKTPRKRKTTTNPENKTHDRDHTKKRKQSKDITSSNQNNFEVTAEIDCVSNLAKTSFDSSTISVGVTLMKDENMMAEDACKETSFSDCDRTDIITSQSDEETDIQQNKDNKDEDSSVDDMKESLLNADEIRTVQSLLSPDVVHEPLDNDNTEGAGIEKVTDEVKEDCNPKDGKNKGNSTIKLFLFDSVEEITRTLEKTNDPIEKKRLQKLYYEANTPCRFSCKLCSFKTKRQSHFAKHEKLHRDKNPIIHYCQSCEFRTIRAAKLTEHLAICGKGQNPNSDPGQLFVPKTMVTCSDCDWIGPFKSSLMKHNIEAHDAKALYCQYCPYFTTRAKWMERHMRTHKSPTSVDNSAEPQMVLKCNYGECVYQTNKKSRLQTHTRDKHTHVKSFLCDLCGTSFKRKYGLHIHRKFMHVDKSIRPLPFPCKICGKRFRSMAHLKEHDVTHTGKRAFLCETCGSAFKTKSAVNRHNTNVHNDAKNIYCEKCNTRFYTNSALTRHLKSEGICGEGEVFVGGRGAVKVPKGRVYNKLIEHNRKIKQVETLQMSQIDVDQESTSNALYSNPISNQFILQDGQKYQIIPTIATTQVLSEGHSNNLSDSVIEIPVSSYSHEQKDGSVTDSNGQQIVVLDTDLPVILDGSILRQFL